MKPDRYAALAWAIFLCTGPADNVVSVGHCMTRLRLHLRTQAPDLAARLARIDGVLGTNQSGDELQLILGPGPSSEAHQTNEFCPTDQITACYSMYRALLNDWAKG